MGTFSQHICRLCPVGIFPSRRGETCLWTALLEENFTLPLPRKLCVSAQWTAAALYLQFAFLFSSCKWKLALRTADLNVLRHKELSFVPMKLTEISFLWWVSLLGVTIPASLGLNYLVHFLKKRTFIPMLFLESYLADQQSWYNEDTWSQSSIVKQ